MYRRLILEYLSGRAALVETLQRLTNFSFFEKTLVKTIYSLDDYTIRFLFDLLSFQQELVEFYQSKTPEQ